MSPHDWLSDLSCGIWPLAANHLWQSTLFCSLAVAAAFLLRRGAARARHAAWLMAAIKFALPSVALAALLGPPAAPSRTTADVTSTAIFGSPAAEIAISEIADFDDRAGSETHNELPCVITLVWAAGFTLVLGRWLHRRTRFGRMFRNGETGSSRELQALRRVITWLGARKDIDLIVVPGMIEPGVWRVFKPVIVLPASLSQHLSDGELESVLMHEVIHVQRHDNLTSTLQMLLCAAFWFHPLVWLIDKRTLEARERACDEEVCLLSGRSEVYASGLLKVLKHCIGLKIAGVSSAAGANLRRRIGEIMHQEKRNRTRAAHSLLVAALALSAVGFTVAASSWSRTHVFAGQGTDSTVSEPMVVPDPSVPETQERNRNQPDLPHESSREEGNFRLRIDRERGDVAEDLKNAPLEPLAFNNDENPPVIITDAKMRTGKYVTISRRVGDNWVHHSDRYVVIPLVTFYNNSGRRVIYYSFGFTSSETRMNFSTAPDKPVEPGASFSLENFGPKFLALTGDPSTFSVRVIGVKFDNGESWGFVPHPPPPPRVRPTGGSESDEQVNSDTALVPIRTVSPDYPEQAREIRITGSVVVAVSVNEQGDVIGAEVVSGHPMLREAAKAAAEQWKFRITRVDGTAFPISEKLTFNFAM